ncbi:MAG: hypothetical protein CVU03_07695 [Bacteroidetes bacterium HGW-Bacteroidetes-2]|jgi:hypothetical protein|nr:MAG: hypothetical protein CVU03_07695 [Bacteroidetes bacterium HGW-Bacteroidetes-2]
MQSISVFLVYIFLAYLITPTFVTVLKNTADVSFVFSVSEEEQSSSERKLVENHHKILTNLMNSTLDFVLLPMAKFSKFFNESLTCIYLNTFSPPPELA